MPFALLMAETLRRREMRDRDKGYTKEYIQTRNSREVWHILNCVLAIVAILVVSLMPLGISVLLCTIINVVAYIIFIISVWKFFKSIATK